MNSLAVIQQKANLFGNRSFRIQINSPFRLTILPSYRPLILPPPLSLFSTKKKVRKILPLPGFSTGIPLFHQR